MEKTTFQKAIEEGSAVLTDAGVDACLRDALAALSASRPRNRSEKDRYYAVTITEMEKVWAYFNIFVTNYAETPNEPTKGV